jgi:protein involved in polysaccharide export with SLBB domain
MTKRQVFDIGRHRRGTFLERNEVHELCPPAVGRRLARRCPRSAASRRLRGLLLLAVVLMLWASPTRAHTQQVEQRINAARVDTMNTFRPGDVVRLRIWREPDLSGDFIIDHSGAVVLPKIGPMPATDVTIDEFRARVLRGYEAYLNQPSIEVIPLRRIQVVGAVRNPGLYTVDPTMTIGDALALAGGATADGRRNEVRLIRGGHSVSGPLSSGTPLAESPLRSGDQLHVPERSWVARNPGVVVGGLSALATLILVVRSR